MGVFFTAEQGAVSRHAGAKIDRGVSAVRVVVGRRRRRGHRAPAGRTGNMTGGRVHRRTAVGRHLRGGPR